jgi:hypothetical protein
MDRDSWESLLKQLAGARKALHHTDTETISYVLQTVIEKLRDEEKLAGEQGRIMLANAANQVGQ